MNIRICDNKQEWNDRLLKQEQPEFLQSWEWGEFQKSVGREVLRLQDEGWQGQGFRHRLSALGEYVYFPRVSFGKKELINDKMINDICELAVEYLRKLGFVFIRLEPLQTLPKNFLSSIIYHLSLVKNRQPQNTLILDLTQTNEALLSAMHPKTRYNIGLAEKKGVEIKEEKDVNVFWKLNQETIKRGKFKSHNKEYYQKMLGMDICHQLIAYYNNKPIASNILIIFGNTCTYLHGASSFSDKNLMAPYLLQWEGIKLAKKMNCRYYDFWGVSPLVEMGENQNFLAAKLACGSNNSRFGNSDFRPCFHGYCWDKSHPWSGVTRFKVGFGGKVKEYPGAADVILNKNKYFVYKLARKILNIKY